MVSNCVFLFILFFSKDKARMLKDREENTVTYQESPPWLPTMFLTVSRPPALKLFPESSHGQIGKQTCPAEQWTLKTIGYY